MVGEDAQHFQHSIHQTACQRAAPKFAAQACNYTKGQQIILDNKWTNGRVFCPAFFFCRVLRLCPYLLGGINPLPVSARAGQLQCPQPAPLCGHKLMRFNAHMKNEEQLTNARARNERKNI